MELKSAAEWLDPDKTPQKWTRSQWWLRDQMPPWPACILAETRALCRVRGTRIVMALNAYQNQHGKLPERLEALVPAFIPEFPLDPYNGQPFHFRICEDREVIPHLSIDAVEIGQGLVWSVGPDLLDDGGGVQGLNREPLDVFFRHHHEDMIFVVPVQEKHR
jgi:hypothetical protein